MASITEYQTSEQTWNYRSPVAGPQSESQRLEELWNAGYLQGHCESLVRFCQSKQDSLKRLLESQPSCETPIEVAKQLVLEHEIVDQRAETLDQITEIESEIWIQGELGFSDRERIAAEWIERHAASWRAWRLKEYLFAIERIEHRIRDCFLNR